MADIATNYFIKALDAYPYNLEETTNSLDYAIAYNEEHSPSLCLMGRMCSEQLKNGSEARHYFELAMLYDPYYSDTYYYYTELLISTKEYVRALEIIKKAEQIPGTSTPRLIHLKALINELNEKFNKAKKQVQKAIKCSINNDEITYLTSELNRIENKLKGKSR